MITLLEVAVPFADDRRADVVFVHGLDEDARTAWQGPDGIHAFWPLWLAEDDPALRVLSVGYRADWTRRPLLTDLAARCAAALAPVLAKPATAVPRVFIAHGFGGLLLKAILRHASVDAPRPATFFIDTPHNFDQLTEWITYTELSAVQPEVIAAIRASRSELDELNAWYAEIGSASCASVAAAFRAPRGVDDDESVRRVPHDGAHDSIARPRSRKASIYRDTMLLIRRVTASTGTEGAARLARGWTRAAPHYPVPPANGRSLVAEGFAEEGLATTIWRDLPQRMKHARLFIDKDIPVWHHDWQQWIDDRIRDSHIVLALLSGRAAASNHVRHELERARHFYQQQRRPRTLAVQIGGYVLDAKLKSLLGDTESQHAVWRSQDDSPHLLDALTEYLQREVDTHGEALKVFLSYKHSNSDSAGQSSARDMALRPVLKVRSALGISFVALPEARSQPDGRPAYIARTIARARWLARILDSAPTDERVSGNDIIEAVRRAQKQLGTITTSIRPDLPTDEEWTRAIDAGHGGTLLVSDPALNSSSHLEFGAPEHDECSARERDGVLVLNRRRPSEPHSIVPFPNHDKPYTSLRLVLRETQ